MNSCRSFRRNIFNNIGRKTTFLGEVKNGFPYAVIGAFAVIASFENTQLYMISAEDLIAMKLF